MKDDFKSSKKVTCMTSRIVCCLGSASKQAGRRQGMGGVGMNETGHELAMLRLSDASENFPIYRF